MLRAITDVLTPDEVEQWMREALSIAHSQKSTRGIMQVLEFAASYSLGRPTQRVQHEDVTTPEQWLAAMLGDDTETDAS